MQTNELRERLASAFHEDTCDVRSGHGLRRTKTKIDWVSAYLLADIALNVFKDCERLSHKSTFARNRVVISGPDGLRELPCGTRCVVQHAPPIDGPYWIEDVSLDLSAFESEEDKELARQDYGGPHRKAISIDGRRFDPRSTMVVEGDHYVIRLPAEDPVSDEPPFDPETDECPECEARPGEPCSMEVAMICGYDGPLGTCPRD